MKTYEQFAKELTPEQRAESDRLFKSVYNDEAPLWCYSDRATDADHFRKIDMNVINRSWRDKAKKVVITPKCKRAKERVGMHGKVMNLLRQDLDGSFLVESLENSYNGKEKWMGWFSRQEAEFKFVVE